MLEHDAEPPVGATTGLHELGRFVHRDLERLLHKHMLARREGAGRHLEMCVRGRQYDDRVDSGIGDRLIKIGRGPERECAGKFGRSLRTTSRGPADVDLVLKVQQALGMRQRSRTETDKGDSDGHSTRSFSISASPRACASSASRVTVKTCFCDIAVSVRSRTSSRKRLKYVSGSRL